MKTVKLIAVAALLVFGLMACTHVTSGMPTTETVNGDAWYVKETGLGFLVFSTSVYYCPSTSQRGPVTCKEAIIHPAGEGASSSSFDEEESYDDEEYEAEEEASEEGGEEGEGEEGYY